MAGTGGQGADAARALVAMMDSSPAGMATVEAAGLAVRHANGPFRRMLGEPFATGGVEGLPFQDVVPGAVERGMVEVLRRVGQTGVAHADERVEVPFAGGTRWWRWSVTPVPGPVVGASDLLVVAVDAPAMPAGAGDGAGRAAAPAPVPVVTVLLADDHKLLRQGLARLLEDVPGISVVGEASDGRQAVALALELKPDVVVMDVNMPVVNGVEATRRIVRALPRTRVIGLSMHDSLEMAETMLAAGAAAFLPKGGPAGDVVAAIKRE